MTLLPYQRQVNVESLHLSSLGASQDEAYINHDDMIPCINVVFGCLHLERVIYRLEVK
jgi:hypothetical protein